LHEFDYERARAGLGVQDSFDFITMIAIWKSGPKENLPINMSEKEGPTAEND
jgi:hypothetical protein